MDNMNSEQLVEGAIVPNFTLPATQGQDVTLDAYRGRQVVIYFYPKDMTPGCTQESCDFRDFHGDFMKKNVVVLGISPDPIEKHHKFISKYELPFVLLSDVDHRVAKLFGAWGKKKNYGREYEGIIRSTFLIDEEGKLVKKWHQVKVDGHVKEVLAAIK